MTTRKNDKGKSKQDQEAVGDDPKIAKRKIRSRNSKEPIETPSPSASMNGNASKQTLLEMAEKGSSSLTFINKASVWSSPRKPDPEMEREGTLVIHFSTYGRSQQSEKAAHAMVQDLQVKGYNILDALYNNEPLDFDNKWADPVIGGPIEPVT